MSREEDGNVSPQPQMKLCRDWHAGGVLRWGASEAGCQVWCHGCGICGRGLSAAGQGETPYHQSASATLSCEAAVAAICLLVDMVDNNFMVR